MPSLRARIVARLLKQLTAHALRTVLAALKLRGLPCTGAALPRIPFLAGLTGTRATVSVAAVTLTALFAVGSGCRLTGRAALRGAPPLVLIGGGAGAVSYLVGRALDVATG